MALDSGTKSQSLDKLSQDLLDAIDNLFGLHPGFRPVHAKGVMCKGTFTPSKDAKTLTRAPHIERSSTPVIVRFSNFAGIPTVPDNDPNGAGPRGFALRFYLADHVHTDIVAHSHDGFPTRTGEEFLELARALATSGPDAPKPTPLEKFAASHPKAKRFLEAPKPIPVSYAAEAYYAVAALNFTNKDGVSRFGRFRIIPEGGTHYLEDAEAAAKDPNFLSEEITQRLARGPIKFRIEVQVAEPGDEVDDSTVSWPEDRTLLKFGTFELTDRVDDNEPEMRKIIFDPIPRVDGMDPSDDPLLELRAAIYLLSGRRRRAHFR